MKPTNRTLARRLKVDASEATDITDYFFQNRKNSREILEHIYYSIQAAARKSPPTNSIDYSDPALSDPPTRYKTVSGLRKKGFKVDVRTFDSNGFLDLNKSGRLGRVLDRVPVLRIRWP